MRTRLSGGVGGERPGYSGRPYPDSEPGRRAAARRPFAVRDRIGHNTHGSIDMIKLRIDGMSCDHCVRAVTEALGNVGGVSRVVEVSLERGEAMIEGEVDPAALKTAVETEGYTADPIV